MQIQPFSTAVHDEDPKCVPGTSRPSKSPFGLWKQETRSELPLILLPLGVTGTNRRNFSHFSKAWSTKPSLLPIRKFHYLRRCLHDDALATISGFALEGDNYQLAYDALKTRYQNKRRLANLYFRRITDFRPLTNSKDWNPRPNMTSLLDGLRQAKYLSKIDLQLAFLQVPLAAETSKDVAAFKVPKREIAPFQL